MLPRDHLATFRHEEEIAGYATRLRGLAGIRTHFPIDVVGAANFLTTRPLPKKGMLIIVKSDHREDATPAFVTFDPLKLHIDRDLWLLANHGDSYCRFVLAHELGHVVLHENGMQPFSGKMNDFNAKSFTERSAEWQANVFAYHFLTPDGLARLAWSAADLSRQALIPEDKAVEVLGSLNKRKLWSKPEKLGESCQYCHNFSLKQNKIFRKCITCGAQTFF